MFKLKASAYAVYIHVAASTCLDTSIMVSEMPVVFSCSVYEIYANSV